MASLPMYEFCLRQRWKTQWFPIMQSKGSSYGSPFRDGSLLVPTSPITHPTERTLPRVSMAHRTCGCCLRHTELQKISKTIAACKDPHLSIPHPNTSTRMFAFTRKKHRFFVFVQVTGAHSGHSPLRPLSLPLSCL